MLSDAVFDVGRLASLQRPLRGARSAAHQEHWLLVLALDDRFALAEFSASNYGGVEAVQPWLFNEYEFFWDAIADLKLERRKHWLVGWRVRHAVNEAGLLEALDDGRVSLPVSRNKQGKAKRSGAFNAGQQTLEIDLVIGRHNVKLVDFANFGVLPIDYDYSLAELTCDHVEGAFRDLVSAATACGLSLSRPSAAQLGWKKMRNACYTRALYVNADAESRALERRAYFGGRNEAFRLGEIPGKTFSLDVRGCYANICATCSVPTYLEREYRAGVEVSAIDPYGDKHWIADVVVKTAWPHYPVRYHGRPIYPTGEFATTLCWPELKHAMERCRVVKVTRAACYSQSLALADYAEWFQEKKAALEAMDLPQLKGFLKSVFNASLGYTARQSREWIPWQTDLGSQWWLGVIEPPDYSEPIVSAHILGGEAEWLKLGGEPKEALPYLHATIASWARVKLLTLLSLAGRREVLYVDTDGLLVTEAGKLALEQEPGIVGPGLGQLTERFAPGRATIRGQKNYKLGENVVCAGLVGKRWSVTAGKEMFTTETGRADADGFVSPFEMRCEDMGDQVARYKNEIL